MTRGDARARMAAGAARLLAERGLDATSFAAVLSASGTARGSTYHHFPGGKRELVHAGLEVAAAHAMAAMEPMRGRPAVEVVERFLAVWRALLEATALRSGCAVLAVTVATDTPELLDHAGTVFRQWTDHLAGLLREGGLTGEQARAFATTTIAATEGAVAMSRAQRTREPFDTVARLLLATVPTVHNCS